MLGKNQFLWASLRLYSVTGFPEGCTTYYGSNPIECHQSMWRSSGCTASGLSYPNEQKGISLKIAQYNLKLVIN